MEDLMTLFWLVILLVCIHKVVKSIKRGGSFVPGLDQSSTQERPASMQKREQDFGRLLDRIKENQKKQESGEYDIKVPDSIEAIYAKEVKEMLKPGYQDDPEWQRLANKDKVKL